ncbi:MAG TPA: AAA family ATPase [Roseovarius sp.]
MRLRQLDLLRYGRFTDRTLDFGDGAGDSDVTVVYGENEAGKSTAFSAWLDLLFGMPHQHPYDFVHARKELLVGATLDTDDGPLTLRRTGQRTGSLSDESGRVVDDRRLELMLYGLDRDSYRTRFSLDDEVLRRGGEEIARARGDLGQLLHAGSSGLSGFAELLKQAEEEVDAFHKPRGRTTTLAEARNSLKALDEAISKARLDPRRFDELRRGAEVAEAACQQADAARDGAKRDLLLREAADRRRALARDIAAAQDRLAGYPGGPDLAEDALTEVSVAVDALKRASEAQAEAEARIEQAKHSLADLTPDPEGLIIGELLAELEAAEFDNGEPLVARASTAAADIQRRRDEWQAARTEARHLAEALAGKGADPGQIVLPRDVLNGIREAAEEVRERARASGDALRRLAETRAELGETETMPDGAEALADALDAFNALPFDPDALARIGRDCETVARQRAAGLPKAWRALADAGLPTLAELRTVERDLKAADDTVAQAGNRLREASETAAQREAERDAETQTGAVVTDAEIAETRARRDRHWAEHRDRLDPETAEVFEAAMSRDDAAREAYGRSVDGRARVIRLDAEIEALQKTVVRRRHDLVEAREARNAPREAVRRLAARLGLDEDTAPAAFFERRDALQGALDAALQVETAAADLRAAEAAQAAAVEKVATAYSAIVGAAAAGDILPAARRLCADLEARQASIASRQEVSKLVRRLEAEVSVHQNALDTAEATYAERTAGLWCANLTVEEMLRKVEGLAQLAEHHRIADSLERRVAQLGAALAAFDVRAAPLREAQGLARDAQVDDILRAGRARAAAAEKTARSIGQAQKDLTDAEQERGRQIRAIRNCEDAIAAQLHDQDQVGGDDPVSAVRALAARDALRAEIARLTAERRTLAEGFDAAALAAEEQDADPLRTEKLREALTAAEAERDEAIGERGKARNALDAAQQTAGGADQVQARAAQLEALREAARSAAITKIGLMAASGALRRLREDRRGPMIEATERAFALMTSGEWQRLEAQPTGTGERLVGIRDGAAVGADAMSTGTRGQLYLALRVAGHADFVTRYGPLPFVTDDILETFDDARATAALALTGEMGRSGQAIMFTHHRHLVNLAEMVIPNVRIVELG